MNQQTGKSLNKPTSNIKSLNDSYEYAFFNTGHELHKIFFLDIFYLQGDHSQVCITTPLHKTTLKTNLEEIESIIPPSIFQRVHKNYIVNINHITKLNYDSIYIDKLELPISKLYKNILIARLNVFK